jgi:hypothetical protein
MPPSNPLPTRSKKSRSPWMWVGIGCGVSALLAFGGCIAFVGFVGQKAAQEMGKPIGQQEAIAKLGDVPIYQPSTFNETMTKGAQFGSSLIPGQIVSAAVAFETQDNPDRIIRWYQQELAAKGYHQLPKQPTLSDNITQASFQKESDGILVQVQNASSSAKAYMLLLMRMKLPKSKTSS